MSDHNIEHAIRTATVPIASNETEEATALGYRGILLNRAQLSNWNGSVPINQYKLNNDSNPEVITKVSAQPVEYDQDIQVRYLRPPTPQPHGDLIIKEQPTTVHPVAPPLIIRQIARAPDTPEILVIREHPPAQPPTHPTKIITIPGKIHEPPPRKVIIEKLAPLPAKPNTIVIERWLPYKGLPRRVVFEGARPVQSAENVRNLIVEWQAPPATIKKKITYLGTVDADPKEYIAKYGQTLKHTHELPPYVNELERPPAEADYSNDLIGDVESLKQLDAATLDREGLNIYKRYLDGSPSYSSSISITPHVHTLLPEVQTGIKVCSSCGQTLKIVHF